MLMGLYLLLSAAIAILGAALFAAVRALRQPDPTRERLNRVREEHGSAPASTRTVPKVHSKREGRPESGAPQAMRQALLTALGQFMIERLSLARNLDQLNLDLERVGRPLAGGVAEYLGLRLVLALGLMVLGAALARGQPPGAVLGVLLLSGLLGSLIPAYWLRRQVQAWQQAIWRDFSDTLDLLALCVSAGQSLDAAMNRVIVEWPGPMADELQRTLAAILLGKSRREALQSMARRIDILEVTSFLSVVIQVELMGGSIAPFMLEQAEDVRHARRLRAEELARQAGTKMLFPLVFCMLPALMAILLGPAVPQLLKTLGSL
jgi:tight adherence protein C